MCNGLLIKVAFDTLTHLHKIFYRPQALAYNNLLGFPHQYGYSGPNLDYLHQKYGFKTINRVNSELITLPSARTPSWAIEEEKRILSALESLAQGVTNVYPEALLGPWIEITYQKNNPIS